MDLGMYQATVLVTGASSGIGKAIANVFGSEGANVVLTYHSDASGAEETVKQIQSTGGNAVAVQMNLKDSSSIRQAIRFTESAFGNISVLVNNALDWSKRQEAGTFEQSSSDDWFDMVQANLFGTYMVTKLVIPSMKQQPWGRLVHISSDLAVDGMAGSSAYTATKSALHGFSKTLSKELAAHSIFSNVVLPGLTLTERAMTSFPKHLVNEFSRQNPSGRLGAPEDVANLVAFLGSQANRFVNGEIIRITGGHSGGYYVP